VEAEHLKDGRATTKAVAHNVNSRLVPRDKISV